MAGKRHGKDLRKKGELLKKSPKQLRRLVSSAEFAAREAKAELKRAVFEREEALAKVAKYEQAINQLLKDVGR